MRSQANPPRHTITEHSSYVNDKERLAKDQPKIVRLKGMARVGLCVALLSSVAFCYGTTGRYSFAFVVCVLMIYLEAWKYVLAEPIPG